MKMTMKVEGVCCPTCADKIEKKLVTVDGIDTAVFAYMTQKLTMEISKQPEDAVDDVERIVHRFSPKAKVVKVRS